ncbi:hypothetical protein Tco_1224198, partial [Tanacetum coccineum]
NGYPQKDKKQGKNWTKPSTGLERAWKTEAEGIPIFCGPTRAHLMGRASPQSPTQSLTPQCHVGTLKLKENASRN